MKIQRLLPLAACLLAIVAFTGRDSAQTAPSPTPPANPGAPHPGGRGHHPAIRAAIGALERAKADMQAAAHDFGGHRVDAIAACDAAIAQLRLALQYANANQGNSEAPAAPSTQ
jgi:hypothetical protein